MKLSRLTLAVATVLSANSFNAVALDLYVDSKTKQLYAEPGPGRVRLGTFERVEDGASQKAQIEEIKNDLALKTNELKALDEAVKNPDEGKFQINDKGIKFVSKDGNFEMGINGRIQVDSQINVSGQSSVDDPSNKSTSTTNELANGSTIRRARIGVSGSYYKDFEYKLEYDFARGNGTNAAGITDAYINWAGYKPFGIKVGQFKEPFSLEVQTSNRWLTFIERNMVTNALSDGPSAYKTGLGITYADPGKRWTAAGAILTEPVGNSGYATSLNGNGNTNRNNGSGDTGWELTGRLTGLPWYEDKNKFVHLGVSGSQRWINNNYLGNGNFSNGGIAYSTALNSNVDRTGILSTGNLSSGNKKVGRRVDDVVRFGGEGAVVYGPMSAQAEYIQADISGQGYDKESLHGYYGYASYFLTGESRAYSTSKASFDRLKPKRNFDMNGGLGAWEMALGYDYLNLNDGVIQGGRASTLKFGLNWYPNSHIKLMANFIHVLEVETTNAAGVGTTVASGSANGRSRAYDSSNMDMVEFRGQVDF